MKPAPLPPSDQHDVPPAPDATPEQREEQALDVALKESFPASDPVAVDTHNVPPPAAARRGK